MDKLYIGISGKMGSGKTTLSNTILSSLEGLKGAKVALADPIKRIQDNIYRDLNLKMEGEKDRDLCIALGMWARSKDPDFWLKQAIMDMKLLDADFVICDDVRFENEAKWFEKNGLLIRIEGLQRGPNVDHNVNNLTETALDDYNFPFYINNSVSAEETSMSALMVIAQYLGIKEDLVNSLARDVIKRSK